MHTYPGRIGATLSDMPDRYSIARGRPVNALTGEVFDNQPPVDILVESRWWPGTRDTRPASTTTRYSTPYTLFFRPGFILIRQLSGAELHMLFHIAELIEPNVEHITLDYAALAADQVISERTARNYVTRLTRLGLILRAGKNRVAFNPEYIWCGGAQKREALVHANRRSADDGLEPA